ncbi:MAG: Lrp/AsnC family transcriptional regulator [Nitrososphaera sp.]|nr:Lrp/AsnC family transcriptional regulator [Nitrososphaera sp.]
MQDSRSIGAGRTTETKADGKLSSNDSIKENSRIALLEQLASFGFAVDQYAECTIEQLQDLVRGARWLQRTYENAGDSSEGTDDDNSQPSSIDKKREGNVYFTEVDKKVLKSLLDSSGRVSSLALSRKLEIPLTTVQRRRKRLESEFLEVSYSLRLDKLGWRKADLLISTHKGRTSALGKELLTHNTITSVSKAIGEHTIDLHAESMFKNNKELLNVIEWIKSLDGVKDVVWTEPVEVVGKNSSMQYEIIDKHL